VGGARLQGAARPHVATLARTVCVHRFGAHVGLAFVRVSEAIHQYSEFQLPLQSEYAARLRLCISAADNLRVDFHCAEQNRCCSSSVPVLAIYDFKPIQGRFSGVCIITVHALLLAHWLS
jgi:hypothetical protein